MNEQPTRKVTVPDLIKILSGQQKEIEGLKGQLEMVPKGLPDFFSLASFLTHVDETERLLDFYSYVLKNAKYSSSQLFQDLFAAYVCEGDTSNTFVEFGATDGVKLSNSLHLESNLGWNGVLCEPDPQWHVALAGNRRNTQVCHDCVYGLTGETATFFSSITGELSTIQDYVDHDLVSMPGNTKTRLMRRDIVEVQTISLNDLIEKYLKADRPSYISVDTEGSEFEILKAFDFNRFGPKVFTVEHNFTHNQDLIDRLMKDNGYERVFKNFTNFDAWYVDKQTFDTRFS